jgi:hypothetical protein
MEALEKKPSSMDKPRVLPAPQIGQIWYIGPRKELHYVMGIDARGDVPSVTYAIYRSLEDFSSTGNIRSGRMPDFCRTLQESAQLVGGPGAPWPSSRDW